MSILAKTRFTKNSRNSIFSKNSICNLQKKNQFLEKSVHLWWLFWAKTSKFSHKMAKFCWKKEKTRFQEAKSGLQRPKKLSKNPKTRSENQKTRFQKPKNSIYRHFERVDEGEFVLKKNPCRSTCCKSFIWCDIPC